MLPEVIARIEGPKTYTETLLRALTMESSKSTPTKLSDINDKPENFMKAVKSFVVNPKGFLLFSGTNGNGKSFSAKAIYNHFWHPHSDNKWWNQADLNMKWQEEFSKWKTTNVFLEDILKAPLLVLDDIGTRKPSESFMDFLYVISDKRYESRYTCGTIITTNLNSKSLREMFGDAFVSRVASGVNVRCDWPDRRVLEF